jgi:hypothetical protein
VAYRHRRGSRQLFRQFRNYGRAEPLLYRLYRHQGLTRPSGGRVARRWARLALEAPAACTSARRRGEWLATAGYSLGRIEGSLRQGALFL